MAASKTFEAGQYVRVKGPFWQRMWTLAAEYGMNAIYNGKDGQHSVTITLYVNDDEIFEVPAEENVEGILPEYAEKLMKAWSTSASA